MSRFVRVSVLMLSIVAVGMLGASCPGSTPLVNRLNGTWAITEQDGKPFEVTQSCPGQSLITFADGKLTKIVSCGKSEQDMTATDWVDDPTAGDAFLIRQYRVTANAVQLADDGTLTLELIQEMRSQMNGQSAPVVSYFRLTFNGTLSEDGTTLTVTMNSQAKQDAAAEWSQIQPANLVLKKQ